MRQESYRRESRVMGDDHLSATLEELTSEGAEFSRVARR